MKALVETLSINFVHLGLIVTYPTHAMSVNAKQYHNKKVSCHPARGLGLDSELYHVMAFTFKKTPFLQRSVNIVDSKQR